MDVDDMVWEDPPEMTTPAYDWNAIAAKVKTRPLKWLRVFSRDRQSLVRAIRQGSVKALHPDKGFETRTANNKGRGDGEVRTCTLYVRYNPTKDKE